MTAELMMFFDGQESLLPLYEKLEDQILAQIPDVTIKVSKTQIAFSRHRGFAFVSFQPVCPAKERPNAWMTVSFGLGYQRISPRIALSTEPYPGRWTHHVMVSKLEDIDDELMSWLREAAEFSAQKR